MFRYEDESAAGAEWFIVALMAVDHGEIVAAARRRGKRPIDKPSIPGGERGTDGANGLNRGCSLGPPLSENAKDRKGSFRARRRLAKSHRRPDVGTEVRRLRRVEISA
jgi:hypothetical protein